MLTLKEMTDSERRDVKTELDRARINQSCPLTNSEKNKIKQVAIERIMQARKKTAQLARVEKKGKKMVPSTETFNWSASISTRPPR